MRVLALLTAFALIAACSPQPEANKALSVQESERTSSTSEPLGEDETEDEEEPEGTLVKAPAAGSPEAVVQGVIAASMYPDEKAGWEALKGLLHSSIKSPKNLENYREINYAASRRKVRLFTPDDTKPYFRVVSQSAPSETKLKLFVHNEQSMPTPCTLKRDEEADNAWRVFACSL